MAGYETFDGAMVQNGVKWKYDAETLTMWAKPTLQSDFNITGGYKVGGPYNFGRKCPSCGGTLYPHGGKGPKEGSISHCRYASGEKITKSGRCKWGSEGQIHCYNCEMDFSGVSGKETDGRGLTVPKANSEAGGTTSESATDKEAKSNTLIDGQKKFEEVIKEICDATDTLFLVKKSTILITDIATLYARATHMDDDKNLKKRNTINFWQMKDESYSKKINQYGMYNTVKVKYNKGTVTEYHEDLVRIFGEKVKVYNDGNIDKSSAKIKAKSYLAHHVRDFGMSIDLTALHQLGYDIGDLVRTANPLTNAKREEIFFISGVSTQISAEDGICSSDIELKFGPNNPDNPEIPEAGFSGKIAIESTSQGTTGLANTSSGFKDTCPLGSSTISKAKSLGSAKAIFDFMRGRSNVKWVRYDGYQRCPDEVLSSGSANCMDQARTATHLLQAIGVKATVIRAPNWNGMGHFHVQVHIDGGVKIYDPTVSSMSQL